jgi:hypothetical protein
MLAAGHDLTRQLGQRPHCCCDVHDLEASLPRSQDRLLPSDHQHGHRAEMRVGSPRCQIKCAGPERGQANARPAGQPPVSRRHERGCLFVAGEDELDAGLPKRFDDV